MDRILALVDGSIYCESVCRHAAWAARRTGAAVDVVHVLGRREAGFRLALGADGRRQGPDTDRAETELSHLAQQRGRAILDEAQALLSAETVPVTTRLMQGDLLSVLRDTAAGTRLIVIGKRGEAADFATGHLGSNLERVVRAARLPIFVASRAFRPILRVLLAFDGSASARLAVERMAANQAFRPLEITLLYVGEERPAIRVAIDEAILSLTAAGLRVMLREMPGEPDEVLRPLVLDEGFDLLVMGAYGHSRIRNLIIGSTTTAMVQAAQIPVLLYR